MKKLAAVLAITAAFSAPAFAQSGQIQGEQLRAPRTQLVVPYAAGLGPIYTDRGVMTDPDPNVRLDLHRNFTQYQNLNGG